MFNESDFFSSNPFEFSSSPTKYYKKRSSVLSGDPQNNPDLLITTVSDMNDRNVAVGNISKPQVILFDGENSSSPISKCAIWDRKNIITVSETDSYSCENLSINNDGNILRVTAEVNPLWGSYLESYYLVSKSGESEKLFDTSTGNKLPISQLNDSNIFLASKSVTYTLEECAKTNEIFCSHGKKRGEIVFQSGSVEIPVLLPAELGDDYYISDGVINDYNEAIVLLNNKYGYDVLVAEVNNFKATVIESQIRELTGLAGEYSLLPKSINNRGKFLMYSSQNEKTYLFQKIATE